MSRRSASARRRTGGTTRRRPIFGLDRDPVAARSWAPSEPHFDPDDPEDGIECEIHGADRAACRRWEADAADRGEG